MKTLHITNGDSVIPTMQKAGVEGEILPWRDILHEGPVPADLDLTSLSGVRAAFISEMGWGAPDKVSHSFESRDNLMQCSNEFEKIILWFEQDLTDQLQLLQILDWYAKQENQHDNLTLIQSHDYLGKMPVEKLKALIDTEKPVTDEQLKLAQSAWSAFRLVDPLQWQSLLQQNTGALPYLASAILRMMQEYPSIDNGLSRTQQQALQAIESGESRPGYVFGMSQEMEEFMFMGDSTFWHYLNQMLQADPPLLTIPVGNTLKLPIDGSQLLTATKEGLEVLHGQRNWLSTHNIDRWVGGVHIKADNLWCWDHRDQALRLLQAG